MFQKNEIKYEYNKLIGNYEKNIKQDINTVKIFINEDMTKHMVRQTRIIRK